MYSIHKNVTLGLQNVKEHKKERGGIHVAKRPTGRLVHRGGGSRSREKHTRGRGAGFACVLLTWDSHRNRKKQGVLTQRPTTDQIQMASSLRALFSKRVLTIDRAYSL